MKINGLDGQFELHGLRLVPKKEPARPKSWHSKVRDKTLSFLQRLMRVPEMPRNARSAPERDEQLRFAEELRRATLEGRLIGNWCSLPNQIPIGARVLGEKSWIVPAIMATWRRMGLITGAADFVFVWKGGGAWLELKKPGSRAMVPVDGSLRNRATPAGQQSPEQKDFESWCRQEQTLYYCAEGCDEALIMLKLWGIYKPTTAPK